jgi:hypothetical protein
MSNTSVSYESVSQSVWPLFVRKIDRAGHWRATNDAGEDRRPQASQDVFPCDDDGTVSVFLASSEADLDRIAMGLNSRRASLSEELRLLTFTKDEALQAGIEFGASTGDTLCRFTNQVHYGLRHDVVAMSLLTNRLFAESRQLVKFSKNKMKVAADAALRENCHAHPARLAAHRCRCEIECLKIESP